jgi:hypothetical protein
MNMHNGRLTPRGRERVMELVASEQNTNGHQRSRIRRATEVRILWEKCGRYANAIVSANPLRSLNSSPKAEYRGRSRHIT